MAEEGEGFVGVVRHGEGVIQKTTRKYEQYRLAGTGSKGCDNYQDDDVMYHVMDEESPTTIWIKLESQWPIKTRISREKGDAKNKDGSSKSANVVEEDLESGKEDMLSVSSSSDHPIDF
ncbi:hypothetical protein NC651_038304 [Populus alba x Populus x berolinensis]|nr:hypothetical protein NC651_038304 [Populus alba x Populus x berolinensis]